MQKKDSRIGIVLFVIGVLLAGTCNALARVFTSLNYEYESVGGTELPFFSTLMFVINIALYLFLIIYWIASVYERILKSRVRSYIIWAAVFMVYFVIYHAVKYRVFESEQYVVMQFLWYSFYIPFIFIPTLFLMSSISIIRSQKNSGKPKYDERLCLIPAFILSALMMTNTLHHFAFIPILDYELSGIPQTYKYGFLYYTVYAYMILTLVIGLVLLTKVNGRSKKPLKIATPFLLFLLIPVMFFANRILTLLNAPQPFLFPDMAMFYTIALLESCIRGRLIPYNNDYVGLFGKMTLPAVIADNSFTRVYESAADVEAVTDDMRKSLTEPVYTDADTKLSGKKIKTGYVFWTEDETELHKAEALLVEANKKIASENELIQSENRLKEEKARVDYNNVIFDKIEGHVSPAHQMVIELSKELEIDDPDFNKKAARILSIDSYIKRCINMMLLGENEEYIRTSELMRSFNESAEYLSLCGQDVVVINRAKEKIKSKTALDFYDAFERISQEAIDSVTEMEITLSDDKMEIMTDGRLLTVVNAGEGGTV